MNSILAKKIEQGQKFLENGTRIPITKLGVDGNIVVSLKTLDKDSYSAVLLGFEKRVKTPKAKSTKSPFRFLREIRIEPSTPVKQASSASSEASAPKVGDKVLASLIFKPGDIINVTGISKGKGYAGGVKRHHFKGGPRTHGQSDRERAPGAIGTSTTPGRVYKGKRMAGRMGHEQVTVKNLLVEFVDDNYILVKGLVPGGRNNLLMLKKVGESKKFVPLYADKPAETKEEIKTEPKEEVKVEMKEETK